LVLAYKKEKRRENQVNNNDHENRHDHRASRRATNLLGTSARGETLQAADGGDRNAKHHALNESGDNITEKEGVNRCGDVTGEGEVGLRDTEKRAAKNA